MMCHTNTRLLYLILWFLGAKLWHFSLLFAEVLQSGLYKPALNPLMEEVFPHRSDLAGDGLIAIPARFVANRNHVPAIVARSAEQSFDCLKNLCIGGEERRNHNRGQFLLWCLHIFLTFLILFPYLYTSNIPHIYHTTKFIFMKTKTSFTLSEDVIRLLKLLAEKEQRSAANMLEILIQQAAKAAKIK